MDNYRTNRSGYSQRSGNWQQSNQMPRPTSKPPCGCNKDSMFEGLDKLPVGMGYVPFTHFGETYDLCNALQHATIFPELYKPFCGRGGGGCK